MSSNIFLKYENISNSRYFKEKNIARKFVIFLFIVSIFTVILLEFLIFISLFYNFKTLNMPVSVYISLISLSLMIIFFISLLSSLSQSINAFVIQRKEEFLLSLPSKASNLVNYRFIKTFYISSLIIILFSFPLLYSYFYIYNYNFIYYLLIIAPLIVVSFLISSIVFFISAFITTVFKKFNLYYISLFFYIVVMLVGFLILIYYIPNFRLLLRSVKVSQFVNVLISKKPIVYFPNYLIANMSVNINYLTNFIVLLSESLIFFLLFQIFLKFAELRLSGYEKKSFWRFNFKKYFVVSKDLNHFISEELRIFNSGIIFFILVVIVFIIFSIGKINIGSYYNFIFSGFCITFGYFMVLFGLYFIFPSFSQEGQAGWIIFSSPIKRISIFYQKNIASLIFMLSHAIWIVIIWALIFNMNLNYLLYFINFAFFITLGISVLFTSLGTAYPNFAKRDIQDLSTTPSGLLSTFIAIFYIFTPVYIFFQFGFIFSILSIYLLFLIILVIFITIGKKKINSMNFAVRN